MLCPVPMCKKKITLLEQTTCTCNKCGQAYCTKHRLMEAHQCSYDSKVKKEAEVQQYIQANKCVNEKMVRI